MINRLFTFLLVGLFPLATAAQEALEADVVSLELHLQSRGLEKSTDPDLHKQWLTSVLRLYDPFGEVLSAEEYERKTARLNGKAVGFGWTFRVDGSKFKVEDDVQETIPTGSVLTHIGNKPVTNLSFSALQTLIRTLPEEETEITVLSPSGETEKHPLRPERRPQPNIALKEKLPEQLGYLRVNGLFDGSDKEVLQVLRAWTETDCYGLILDLRQATGTNLDAAEKIASLLVSEGEFLFAYRSLDNQDLDVRKAVVGGPIHQPVMVLIDKQTAGASEVLAASLAGTGRGVMILGQPSSGDPLIREFVPFSETLHLYVTERKLVTSDGKEYVGGQAVDPHVVVRTRDGTPPFEPDPESRKTTLEEENEDFYIRNRVRYDPVLRRAVDVLLGLKALNIRTDNPDETP